MILSYVGICYVWCIEENKSNGIVYCESEIQCRYFYEITTGGNFNMIEWEKAEKKKSIPNPIKSYIIVSSVKD